jgi:Family of unknown function (DUF5681)
MPWKKGQSGNPAGKKVGTTAQMLREVRTALTDHVKQENKPHPLVALYELGLDTTVLPEIRLTALRCCLHYMAPELKPMDAEPAQPLAAPSDATGSNVGAIDYRAAITPLAPRSMGDRAASGQD